MRFILVAAIAVIAILGTIFAYFFKIKKHMKKPLS